MKTKKLSYEIPDILDYLNQQRNLVSLNNQEELIAVVLAQTTLNEVQTREIIRLFFEEWITGILHGYHMELKCGKWERPTKKGGALEKKIKFSPSKSLKKKIKYEK